MDFVNTEYLVQSAFRALVNREVDKESCKYWTTKLRSGEHSLTDFLFFLRSCPESIDLIYPEQCDYIIRKAYSISGLGSEAGDPFIINTNRKKVYFMHIPKTAGIAFMSAAGRLYHPLQIEHLSFGGKVNQIGKKFICGHYSMADIHTISKSDALITILRSPAKRIKSLYSFLRNHVPDTSQIWGKPANASRKYSLRDFLEIQDPEINFCFDNYYARVFSGLGVPHSCLESAVTSDMYRLALRNLKRFDIVLMQEELLSNTTPEKKNRDLVRIFGLNPLKNLMQKNVSNALVDLDEDRVPTRLIEIDIQLISQSEKSLLHNETNNS